MPSPITIRVDSFAPTMTRAEFDQAVVAMGGITIPVGADYTIINAIGPTPEHAMKAFVTRMTTEIENVPGHALKWRLKPNVGTRRQNSVIEHVVSARFRLDPAEDPQDV